ncbi:M48 family metalloprotease [Ramlibacter tataouinensis]|uniref:M48 family metalloprotease n=1 Tax=Ramlibacter tataouinensis TaxID=94132 RepID=UPI0022F3C28B|nr:M48 family metalloprotease [Ramlibacter tataouinensis]WBY00112.1 M48 family metalloprotease [Ramlibacter tataouinensis]
MAPMSLRPRTPVRHRLAAAALAAVVACFPAAHAQLPTLGDGSEMSSAAERRLGEKIARELYRDPDYIDDPVLVDYVQDIWQRLLDAARARGELSAELDERFAWQVLLGKDRSVNAFALPGGWLGLHLGLVSVTASRDELASVLAHELSHVTQRHISRLVSQEKRQAPWVIGAMILGALAAKKSPDAANAMISGSQAMAVQNQLNFSRDMEREADRIGYGILVQGGFDPQGFVGMFDKLQQAGRLNDSGAFPYLRTHPMTTERSADMQARLQLLPREQAQGPAGASLLHALMAARARALSAVGVDALRALAAEPTGLPADAPRARRAASLYAASLAASRLRDTGAAVLQAQRLSTAVAGDAEAARQARLLAAEVALAGGRIESAAALLDGAARARPEVLLWAQARQAAGHPAEVAQRLQGWVAQQPRDAAAWQLLSTAYGAQGQSLRAIRAAAEAQVAQLDYGAALDRLKAAQDLARRGGAAGDHIEASIIDTRTREVESLFREQSLER